MFLFDVLVVRIVLASSHNFIYSYQFMLDSESANIVTRNVLQTIICEIRRINLAGGTTVVIANFKDRRATKCGDSGNCKLIVNGL